MVRRVRLTADAEADITRILSDSERLFGRAARRRYDLLLRAALKDMGADSRRAGVRVRSDLGPHLHAYHLHHSREQARLAGALVRRPRHILIFTISDPDRLDVVRVLHDSMDIARHLPPDYRAS